MWRLIKAVCFVVCPLAVVAFGKELVGLLMQLPDNNRLKMLAVGFFSGMIGWLALGRQLMMWCVLEHELTHAFVAVAFLRRVRSLTANETCGAVALDGNVNFLVSLAPYFLPTLALLWLPACILLREQYHIIAIIFLGVLLGYHAISNKQEFHPGQPDIQQSGFVFSVLFCLAASLVIFGFIAAVAASGSWSGGTEFLVDGWRAIMDWVQKYISAILDFLHSFSAIVGQTTHNG